jgi:hypothetical protein
MTEEQATYYLKGVDTVVNLSPVKMCLLLSAQLFKNFAV